MGKYNPNKEISKINAEAARLGLTYGVYVAQQYELNKRKPQTVRKAVDKNAQ